MMVRWYKENCCEENPQSSCYSGVLQSLLVLGDMPLQTVLSPGTPQRRKLHKMEKKIKKKK
ncbi:hypothetical protein RhiirB3_434778 [Rhizophagus irregularis]|nr:hypothetical protein RhiirB3_434778 [Rhizophagus irregularis]